MAREEDDRPQYQHGTGTIGGTTFHWGSGTPGRYWSVPYGDYPVTPDAPTGDWAHRVGAIPIANNVIPDPKLGRDRIGIMIHSGSASSLDALYTQGCFKVAPAEWPGVRKQILEETQKGPLYLHVQPGGVASFTNTKTLEQTTVPTAAAPGPPATSTTINNQNTPVAGALAKPEVGPENAGGPATAASEGPLDVRQLVYNKLTGAGLQSHQALGAIWSLAGESGAGLNPGAYNPKDPGGSVGIGQWLGPRRAALEAFAKSRGTAVTDPTTQTDFLVDELTNEKAATYQPGVFKAMQGAGTAADATKVWTSQFERPKVDNSDARIRNGIAVASLDDKGGFVLGKGVPANSAVASGTTSPTSPTSPPADKSWWDKLTTAPTDAEGKPVAGAKSPMQELTQGALAKLSNEGQTEKQEQPAQSALSSQGPGARNVSTGLGNASQVYGQTLNSFSQPLTWGHGAQGVPGMPMGGLRAAAASPVPGMSLSSLPVGPGGLGYGIDPNLGYGFS